MRKGHRPLHALARTTRGAGRIRGGDSRVESHASLRSVRPVQRSALSKEIARRGWLVARVARFARSIGARERERGARRPSSRSRTDTPRVIARASSVCRSRQAVFGLEKARPRRRTGRKLVRSKRRVDASLAPSGIHPAVPRAPTDPRRENVEGRTERKENGSNGRDDPHHVSVVSRSSVSRSRARFGAHASREAPARWKASRIADARHLSRGPRENDLGRLFVRIARIASRNADRRGGRQRRQRRVTSIDARKTTPRARSVNRRSGGRAVKRRIPRSRPH
jgi:hypothetical protein